MMPDWDIEMSGNEIGIAVWAILMAVVIVYGVWVAFERDGERENGNRERVNEKKGEGR